MYAELHVPHTHRPSRMVEPKHEALSITTQTTSALYSLPWAVLMLTRNRNGAGKALQCLLPDSKAMFCH